MPVMREWPGTAWKMLGRTWEGLRYVGASVRVAPYR